jgi:hypothetical protein
MSQFEGLSGSDKSANIQAALADAELGDQQRTLLVLYFMGERRATMAEALGLRSEGSISGMLSKAKKLLPPELLAELSGGLARFRKPEQSDNPLQSPELDALGFDELSCLVLYCVRGRDVDYIAAKIGLSDQVAMATLARAMHALSPDLRQKFVTMRQQHEGPGAVQDAA